MNPPSLQEFRNLVFETQYLLEKHGYHYIIDGPDTTKAEYKGFLQDIVSGKLHEPEISGTMEKAQGLASRAASTYGPDSFRAHTYLSQMASLARISHNPDPETLVYLVHGTDISRLKSLAQEVYRKETDFWCGYLKCDEKDLPHEIRKYIESKPSLSREEALDYLKKTDTIIDERLSEFFSPEEIGRTEFYYSEGPEGGYNEPAAIGFSRVTVRIKDNIDRLPVSLLASNFHEKLHTVGYGAQMRTGQEAAENSDISHCSPASGVILPRQGVVENSDILLDTIHTSLQESIACSWKAFYRSKEELMEELNPILPAHARLNSHHLAGFESDITRSRAYLHLKWHDLFVRGIEPERLVPEIQYILGIPEERVKNTIDFMNKWKTYHTTYIAAEGIVLPRLRRAMDEGRYGDEVRKLATEPSAEMFIGNTSE